MALQVFHKPGCQATSSSSILHHQRQHVSPEPCTFGLVRTTFYRQGLRLRHFLFDGRSGYKGLVGNGLNGAYSLSRRQAVKVVAQNVSQQKNEQRIFETTSSGQATSSRHETGFGQTRRDSSRRRTRVVRAITTEDAYKTLAELEKRLDEEAGEYSEDEYSDIKPDRRLVAREPVQKVMDFIWLHILEELPVSERTRPDEYFRDHWRWAVEAFLVYAFGDNWPSRFAVLTRSGEPALFPIYFEPQEMPDIEPELQRLEREGAETSGKAGIQSKRRLEKEKKRIRIKLAEQWTDSERMRAGELRSFLTEEEESRFTDFWARFERRFGADWKQKLEYQKESGLWKLDGNVVRPAEELVTLMHGEEWLQRAQKVHGNAWWKAIQEEKSKEFWAQRFQQREALVAFLKEKDLWPHRVWAGAKDEVWRIAKAGKKWRAIWTKTKELLDDDVWLAFDEGDKLFHREEQIAIRKYPKGLVELEMNLDKEPQYVELRRQHRERQLEKKEWTFGALPDAYSRLHMLDGRYTTAADEEEKVRSAEAPPVFDVRPPPDYHLEPNPMRDSSNRPRDVLIFPRNCRIPKSWPPPGWEVPADELAFLREGEEERDYLARAAIQAAGKLGARALDVVKESGEFLSEKQANERWQLFLTQYHAWRDANVERLDEEGKEMDSFLPKGYEPGRRRVGKWMEVPRADKEVQGMYELPFLERGQVYEGFVTSVDLHAGAFVAFGGVHDGYVPVSESDWDFGNVWDIIEVGTKCVVEVVEVRDPFRFRFPVEMRFLDPDITPLLKGTVKERQAGAPIIGRKGDWDLEEVAFEAGRRFLHGPQERVEEELTSFDLEHLHHPDQDWTYRKGVVEQRMLADEEFQTAMENDSPLPLPILFDWDYIADPGKRVAELTEQAREEKLTVDGRSNLPRDEHKIGELMEDMRYGEAVNSMVTIESVTDRMTDEERSMLDLATARRDREAIRTTLVTWLEENNIDWASIPEELWGSVWDELEENRPRFPWEAKVTELYQQEVSYNQARLLAHEEYDAEVKLRGLWNETPYKLPDIAPYNEGEKEARPTPVFYRDRLRRELWGDAERPFPDIPSRKEEWRAENARLNKRMEEKLTAQKEAKEAAKQAAASAERKAAGLVGADGTLKGGDDEDDETEDEELDDELDVVT